MEQEAMTSKSTSPSTSRITDGKGTGQETVHVLKLGELPQDLQIGMDGSGKKKTTTPKKEKDNLSQLKKEQMAALSGELEMSMPMMSTESESIFDPTAEVAPFPSLVRSSTSMAVLHSTRVSRPGAVAVPGPGGSNANVASSSTRYTHSNNASSTNVNWDGSESPPAVPQLLDHDQDQDSDLARAQPVDHNHNLPQAQEVTTTSGNAKKTPDQRHHYVYAAVAILFIVAVAFLVAFLPDWNHRNNHKNNNANVNTTSTGSIPPLKDNHKTQEYIESLLPPFTLDAISKSNSSPQAQALQWTLQDPNLDDYPDWRILQRFALVTFFFATNGLTHWIDNTHWLDYNVSECDWFTLDHVSYLPTYNVTDTLACHGPNNNNNSQHEHAYKHLWLWANNLVGTAPSEIFYLLPSLYSMDFSENANLEGTIPTHIHKLSNLECLDLTVCSFTGTIPTEIGLMNNHLSAALNLGANQLTGTIPSQLGLLTQLTNILSLWQNLFTGTFPKEMWSLSNLNILAVSYNEHLDHQVIPTEVANLQSVTWLDLRMTMLTGSIPSQIGSLSRLENLRLGTNDLQGTLPTELGLLSSTLLQISAKHNRLSGSIPPQLFFQQGAAAGAAASIRIEIMDLAGSHLTGTIPTEIGLCTSMKILSLADNLLSGPIPSEMGLLSQMGTQALGYLYGGLDLSYNVLSGTIPDEIGNLSGLSQRELTSDFWTFDGSTFSPTYLLLNHNRLIGTIPLALAQQLTELNRLDVSVNHLSGTIPSEMGQWSHLMTLNVAHNPLLGGTIPEALGSYALNGTLTVLNVTNTAVEGVLPEGLCVLEQQTMEESSSSSLLLDFDCSSLLCGCRSCPCDSSSSSSNNLTGALP